MQVSEALAACRKGAAVAVLAVALVGCGARPLPPWEPPQPISLPPPGPVAAPVVPSSSASGYMQRVRQMNAEELMLEYNRLQLEVSPQARLQLALILAAPNFPLRDEQRAQQHLEELLRSDSTPAAVRDHAALAALWLEESRRAEAERRRAQAKAREDETRIQQLEARQRELERRAADAEKKLEALRSIERELSSRANGRAP